jgi:phosphoribosylaminoimidazole-succinocarboxamide synthase
VIEGKGRLSNETTCGVFRLLQLSGLPTHFLGQEGPDSFRCATLPRARARADLPSSKQLKFIADLTCLVCRACACRVSRVCGGAVVHGVKGR